MIGIAWFFGSLLLHCLRHGLYLAVWLTVYILHLSLTTLVVMASTKHLEKQVLVRTSV